MIYRVFKLIGLVGVVLPLSVVFVASCDRFSILNYKIEPIDENNLVYIAPYVSTNNSIIAGNELFIHGKYNDAIKLYEEGLADNSAIAYYNMGLGYYRLGNISNAKSYFMRAMEANASLSDAVINLAIIYAQEGDAERAEFYLSRIDANTRSAKIYTTLANIELSRGEAGQAAYHYETALSISPDSPFVLANYASFLINTEQVGEGMEILNSLDEETFYTSYTKALGYYFLGMYEQANEFATNALTYKASSAFSYEQLAILYQNLKNYKQEAKAYERVVDLRPSLVNRYNLSQAYYKSENFTASLAVVDNLYKDYPDNVNVIILKYNNMLALSQVSQAEELIDIAFRTTGSDRLLYYMALHRYYYRTSATPMSRIIPYINQGKGSDYALLAKVVYYISQNDFVKAEEAIGRVRSTTLNEYNIYRSYLLIREKRYAEALAYSRAIDDFSPEYFWHNLIVFWDLGLKEDLYDLLNRFSGSRILFLRLPDMDFYIDPSLMSIPYRYRFEGEPYRAAFSMMYPLLISPDTMLDAMVAVEGFASNTAAEDENRSSFAYTEQQLAETANLSESIRLNNVGVQYFMAYDYASALKNFERAVELTPALPYTLYNIGLANHVLGKTYQARYYYNLSVYYNQYVLPGYVGLGILEHDYYSPKLGDEYFDTAVNLYRTYIRNNGKRSMHAEIADNVFLALLAGSRFDEIPGEIANLGYESSFASVIETTGQYYSSGLLELLASSNILKEVFRGKSTLYTLAFYYASDDYSPQSTNDRLVRMQEKYIQQKMFGYSDYRYLNNYANDAVVMLEMMNNNIYLNKPNTAYDYMTLASNIDGDSPYLYQSMYYYFLWQKDYVNAEAARGTFMELARTNGSIVVDRYVDYYDMLFALNTRDLEQINDIYSEYVRKYGNDLNGDSVHAASLLIDLNIEQFFVVVNDMYTNYGDSIGEDSSLRLTFK